MKTIASAVYSYPFAWGTNAAARPTGYRPAHPGKRQAFTQAQYHSNKNINAARKTSMKTPSVLSVVVTLAAIACFSPVSLKGDFSVAYTAAVEQRPAVAYNSQTGKFLVAYAIQYNFGMGTYYGVQCQLHNADGSKSGPVLYPFGDLGVIAGLGRPAIAYNHLQNIFFVAVPVFTASHDYVIGRFLNGDGTSRVGPDFLFNDSANEPRYLDGFGTGSLHIVYNSLLDEFLVSVQRVIYHSPYGTPERHNTVAAQRITESHHSSVVELSDFGLNGLQSHAVAYAPIAGTTPAGGRYLYVAGRGTPAGELLDSQLNRITYVPVKWGNPDGEARDHDIAYGEVAGQNMFLLVWSDSDNCAPGHTPPCTGLLDQWTGVWGAYVDPLVTSYPTPPSDRSFPISYVYSHTMTSLWPVQGPRVSYAKDVKGFFVAWRECPSIDLQNDEMRSHIRGAFVDYYVDAANHDAAPRPVNAIISDVTGQCAGGGYWCPSEQDPEFPAVAALSWYSAAVVWHQKYPPNPTDFDIMGDIYHHTPDADRDGYADGVEVLAGSNPNDPSSIPNNLASRMDATGILGTMNALGGSATPVFHMGTATNINDGDLSTRVDTWNGTGTDPLSYVGITWARTQNASIGCLRLDLATFGDGGWFGPNYLSPGPAGLLAPAYLIEPDVQITTDGGVTWTTVPHTSDYLTALNGHRIATSGWNPTLATAVFQLNPTVSGIKGIRLVGTEGGIASGGFLGVFELGALTKVPVKLLNPKPVKIGRPPDWIPGLQFQFDSQAGITYEIQRNTGFAPHQWTTVGTTQQIEVGRLTVVAPVGAAATAFFRVITR